MTAHAAALVMALQISAPGIPLNTIHQAETIASFILAKAGISVAWQGEHAYHIQVMDSLPKNLSGDAAGFAVLTPEETGYAAISFPSVKQNAESLQADPAVLLGATIAHEAGHLLLGPAHYESGIMRPRFNIRELRMAAQGQLLFSDRQAAAIREKLAARPTPEPSVRSGDLR